MNKHLVAGDVVVSLVGVFLTIVYIFNYLENNSQVKQVLISTNQKEEIFSLTNEAEIVRNNVKIKINSGKVFVVESSCQNKICIKTGSIKNPGQLIVCAPNKVIIKIVSNKNKLDAFTY